MVKQFLKEFKNILLENEDELEDFLASNLTVDEATELEISLRGE